MRTPILVVLLLCTLQLSAKKPASVHKTSFSKFSLNNGNILVDVPRNFSVDSEYYHYWDNCLNGGYSIAFKGDNNDNGGMTMQINLHDHVNKVQCPLDGYEPGCHARNSATIISDTTYVLGDKTYTVVATQAAPGRRRGTRTHNYHLSYYITANGQMLELHYNYWDKDGNDIKYWRDKSFEMANTLRWQSSGGVTAAR